MTIKAHKRSTYQVTRAYCMYMDRTPRSETSSQERAKDKVGDSLSYVLLLSRIERIRLRLGLVVSIGDSLANVESYPEHWRAQRTLTKISQ